MTNISSNRSFPYPRIIAVFMDFVPVLKAFMNIMHRGQKCLKLMKDSGCNSKDKVIHFLF